MPKKKRLTNEVIERMEEETKKATKKKKETKTEEPKEEIVQEVVDTKSKKETKKAKKIEKKKENEKLEEVVDKAEEQIEENTELIAVAEENAIDLKREDLKEIAEEIKRQREIPKHRKFKINKKIWENAMYAIFCVIVLMGLQFVYLNTDIEVFRRTLKLTSIILMCITIVIFEIAYKKNNTTIAGHGIEVMFLSLYNLICLSFYLKTPEDFVNINVIALSIFLAYFVIKSIVVDIIIRKRTRHHTSDIHEITKNT